MDRKHLEDHRERSQKEKLIEARDKLAKPLKSLASAILHKQGDHEPQEKDVAKSVDEKKLKVHADTIESLLRFSPSSSLVQGLETALQSAFNEYAALMGMQRKNELSEIVLNAFYKSNEILDLLKSIEAFIVSLDSISDPSVAYLMAFNNYVYFLRLSVEKMKTKYTQADQSPENTDIACDPDTVNWFIQNECRQITAVRDLPKARRAAQRLTESTNSGSLRLKRIMRISLWSPKQSNTCTIRIPTMRPSCRPCRTALLSGKPRSTRNTVKPLLFTIRLPPASRRNGSAGSIPTSNRVPFSP